MTSHWVYQGHVLDIVPEGAVGFIYTITHRKTGKSYIGKKQCYSETTKAVAGRKTRKHTVKESNWRTYTSSCEPLQQAIKAEGADKFVFEIVKICYSKINLTYSEVELQICRDVLRTTLDGTEPAYWNDCIANVFWRGRVTYL